MIIACACVCVVQSRVSQLSDDDEDDDFVPTQPTRMAKQSSSSSSQSRSKHTLGGSAGSFKKSIGASPRMNRVADHNEDGGAGGVSAAHFASTPSKSIPGQMGRHAGANSIGHEDELTDSRKHSGVVGGGSTKKPPRKTLQPSSQQKRQSMVGATSGGPKKGGAKDYVASRVWKNESSMTFGMRVKLAEQPEMWADAGFAATNIVDVWEHYDQDKDDRLGRHEAQALASDLVDRYIALYRTQLLADQPGLSDSDLQRLIKKDVFPHVRRQLTHAAIAMVCTVLVSLFVSPVNLLFVVVCAFPY